EIYQRSGFVVDLFRISYETDYEMFLEGIDEYDHILISGGDGTINQVINVLKKNKKNIPVGIIPLGTSNDFARHLKIPKDILEVCERIMNNNPTYVDIGKINDRYFVNIASYGIFTSVSQGTDIGIKKILGKYSYYLTGIKELRNFKKIEVDLEIDGVRKKENIVGIFVFNGTTAGHLNLAHKASTKDGKLDLVLLKPKTIMEGLDIAKQLFKDNKIKTDLSGIEYIQAKNIKIIGEEKVTDLDGEEGPKLPVSIECIRDGLQVLGVL
ncbi:MAG: YegS/Rv2252/BmrU family lipid kinase, partial [Cetobacterium sp.]